MSHPRTEYSATPATDRAFRLAEGPVWDPALGRVIWVDILDGAVFEGRLDVDAGGSTTGVTVTAKHRFDGMVGAAVPVEGGGILVAGQERLVTLRTDGTRVDGPTIVTRTGGSRTNDGGVDPQGRLLMGTVSLDGVENEEILVRVEHDGSVLVIDDDLGLSNGLAWSADGSVLYSTDTERHTIYSRPYPASGAPGVRTPYLEVSDGYPDGMCLDTDGCLWVAIWGAGEVRRYAPDGRILAVVHVNAPNTSSVAFVGETAGTLLISTARKDLDDAALAAFPDSGKLFLAKVDATGVPTTPVRSVAD